MLDFLKNFGIDNEVITNIYANNTSESIYNLKCDQKNCVEIINYLKELNIKVIDDLLIYKIGLFLEKKEELAKKFSKFNIPVIVSYINDDYVVIEEVLGE